MIVNVVQRWAGGRASYRPAREVIDTRALDVSAIPDDTTARAFVEAHHYSASYPAARYRFGLHERGELVGVAVFSQPINNRSLAVLPGTPLESVELGRLVLLAPAPAAELGGRARARSRCPDPMLTAVLALLHAPHPLAAIAGGVLVGIAVVLPLLARAAG